MRHLVARGLFNLLFFLCRTMLWIFGSDMTFYLFIFVLFCSCLDYPVILIDAAI